MKKLTLTLFFLLIPFGLGFSVPFLAHCTPMAEVEIKSVTVDGVNFTFSATGCGDCGYAVFVITDHASGVDGGGCDVNRKTMTHRFIPPISQSTQVTVLVQVICYDPNCDAEVNVSDTESPS